SLQRPVIGEIDERLPRGAHRRAATAVAFAPTRMGRSGTGARARASRDRRARGTGTGERGVPRSPPRGSRGRPRRRRRRASRCARRAPPPARLRVTDSAALVELRFAELLEALGGEQVPASGSAAALTGAMAAELVAMAARAATGWADGPGVAAQAKALSVRLVPLAGADADAFARVVALRADPAADERDLGPALDRSAELPLAIADAAAATAELAALTAAWATGYELADAVAAAALAAGAVRPNAAL